MNNKNIYAVSSSTYAIKGVDALASAGIRARVVTLRANETKKGCAYGISVNSSDGTKAGGVLLRAGVMYSEILT